VCAPHAPGVRPHGAAPNTGAKCRHGVARRLLY
jgi:hypothetical protein